MEVSNVIEAQQSATREKGSAGTSQSTGASRVDRQTRKVKGDGTDEKSDKKGEGQDLRVDMLDIEEAVKRLEEIAELANPRLTFAIDKDIDEVVITVVDKNTGEVIRQIPPEEVVSRMKQRKELEEHFRGVFTDSVA